MKITSASHRLAKQSRKNGNVYSYRLDQIQAIKAGDSIDNHEPAFFDNGTITDKGTSTIQDYALGLDHNGNKVQ